MSEMPVAVTIALASRGGYVSEEGSRGGVAWRVVGDRVIHETWMCGGPVEESETFLVSDLLDALGNE